MMNHIDIGTDDTAAPTGRGFNPNGNMAHHTPVRVVVRVDHVTRVVNELWNRAGAALQRGDRVHALELFDLCDEIESEYFTPGMVASIRR